MSSSSWRSWCVPVAGALVLANSFGPWWVLKLAPGGRLAEDYGSHIGSFSAWQAPGQWALAVVLALSISAVWIAWHLRTGGVPELSWDALASNLNIADGFGPGWSNARSSDTKE